MNIYELSDSIGENSLATLHSCFFRYIQNFIIPSDELIFFRGVGFNHQASIMLPQNGQHGELGHGLAGSGWVNQVSRLCDMTLEARGVAVMQEMDAFS